MNIEKKEKKAFITKNSENGQSAYNEDGSSICYSLTCSVIPNLIEMGYTEDNIFFSSWVSVSEKLFNNSNKKKKMEKY